MRNDHVIMILFWITSLVKVKTVASQGVLQGRPTPHPPPLGSQLSYTMDQGYDKNARPSSLTEVNIALYINRISGVDETKEEISFDVFLKVVWQDSRIRPNVDIDPATNYIQLTTEERHTIWVPDLYIRQLREMRVLSLFEEISSLRLYLNSTISLSIGATIIIKCDMDFVLYPLDVQKCSVDFSSYKYSDQDMIFKWRDAFPLMFPNDFGDGFFRLPKYVVSFYHSNLTHTVNYGDADHCSARLEITLSREVKSYLLENYLPSTLFVSISWGSFVVVPDIVPGRMVLLVTTLLSLVTMFDTVSNNSPDALELKCIEVWLISCTLFVFLALMEYFIVLFGIRYDKHWRTTAVGVVTGGSGGGKVTLATALRPSPSPIRLRAGESSSIQINNDAPFMLQLATAASSAAYRRNGLLSRNKVNPEVLLGKDVLPVASYETAPSLAAPPPPSLSQTTQPPPTQQQEEGISSTTVTAGAAEEASEARSTSNATTNTTSNTNSRRRFRNVAEHAVLYAGSQRGRLDQISLILFPLSFLIFTIVYWIYYLSESKKKM